MPLLRFRRLVVVALLLGCGEGTSSGPDLPPRFQTPVMLPAPVTTDGWEDSGFISPDGDTLYFTYLRIDAVTLFTTGQIRLSGPLRPGWPTQPPYDTIGSEIYRSVRVAGAWTEPEHLDGAINFPQEIEGDEWVSADGNRILFTNGISGGPRGARGIWYAERQGGVWMPAVLASTVGFPFDSLDENPHLTLDESQLFFESSRAGGYGQQDIWMSTRVSGQWSAPVNLGPAVNGAGVEGSPFTLDGSSLYFDDKGGGKGISWSHRDAGGSWSDPVVLVPGVFGDPSLTLAGDLYIVGGRQVPGGFDADLYLARRR
jgi:hypothetical protein